MNIDVSEIEPRQISNAAHVLQNRFTWEEFLNFGEDNTHAEWIDGKVIVLLSHSRQHQELISHLLTTVGLFAEKYDLGKIIVAPFAMKLTKQRRGREPDILFVSKEREYLLEKNFLNGAADLAIEIVSPESVERDGVTKFVEYEAAGIKEYWLIDYETQSAIFYEFDANNQYQAAELADGTFHSKVLPNFFIRESWLWREKLSALEALSELGVL